MVCPLKENAFILLKLAKLVFIIMLKISTDYGAVLFIDEAGVPAEDAVAGVLVP